jgi:iron complex transport system substrate-binding protein
MKKSRSEKSRIVSLAPSATSILCALGAKSALVGVTRWCADVAPVKRLPELGDCWKLDIEEVLRLKPTLVIGSVPYKQEIVARLLEQPFSFLAMNPRTLADVESDIFMLGQITGRNGAARKAVARMRREFAAIAKKARSAKRRPRVYCEAWPNPRISSPPWVAELVRIAGGDMVLPPGQRDGEASSQGPSRCHRACVGGNGRQVKAGEELFRRGVERYTCDSKQASLRGAG